MGRWMGWRTRPKRAYRLRQAQDVLELAEEKALRGEYLGAANLAARLLEHPIRASNIDRVLEIEGRGLILCAYVHHNREDYRQERRLYDHAETRLIQAGCIHVRKQVLFLKANSIIKTSPRAAIRFLRREVGWARHDNDPAVELGWWRRVLEAEELAARDSPFFGRTQWRELHDVYEQTIIPRSLRIADQGLAEAMLVLDLGSKLRVLEQGRLAGLLVGPRAFDRALEAAESALANVPDMVAIQYLVSLDLCRAFHGMQENTEAVRLVQVAQDLRERYGLSPRPLREIEQLIRKQ